ncbi:MAG: response regulator [Bacteroidota bacterium]
MKADNTIRIFLVDDDAVFLKALEIDFLNTEKYIIETYSTGELCLANLDRNPDLIILDYQLDGIDKKAMNGIETLDKIKEYSEDIPVVMLSSQDKIDVAVDCMHHKALDYVIKSETAFLRLQKIIPAIFRFKKMEKQLNWYMERM